jgi:hypothetical protein
MNVIRFLSTPTCLFEFLNSYSLFTTFAFASVHLLLTFLTHLLSLFASASVYSYSLTFCPHASRLLFLTRALRFSLLTCSLRNAHNILQYYSLVQCPLHPLACAAHYSPEMSLNLPCFLLRLITQQPSLGLA